MPKGKQKPTADIKPVDVLSQVTADAAGLDIGAEEIYACVPADRDSQSVRAFGTLTRDLYALADWLTTCGVKTVAMESTGVYWIPIYEILDSRGFEVCLVNARHLKNVTGRKTDVLDCQWIQQLHSYGLLPSSFRPSDEMCALRALVRQRKNLIRYRAAHIQHMQKALQQMNVQLTQVVSDITGVTGLSIMRAIVGGQHDPHGLAQLRDPRCAKSEDQIAAALEGNYRPEHLFVLRQALEQYDFYDRQIRDCDTQIEAMYATLPPANPGEGDPPPPPKPTRRKARKNQAHFDLAAALYHLLGIDLTAITGLDALTIQDVITEIDVDISPWPTVKHFTSWLCLAPHTKKSGGKVLSSRTRKTQNRASTALRIAAQSLSRSHSALGNYYRRMRARLGPAQANVATAHKLARIIYYMLKYRQPYIDPGEAYDEQQHRERTLRNLQRRAAALGFQLTPTASQEVGVS